ncbi:MAG: hypothetical protein MK171_05500 [Pirellulales bacterium]|nr:hypothetical protein [Pirellulales bacterium]
MADREALFPSHTPGFHQLLWSRFATPAAEGHCHVRPAAAGAEIDLQAFASIQDGGGKPRFGEGGGDAEEPLNASH